MERRGLLIDYEFCTGCHSCEMACKAEHGLEKGQWGIKVAQVGPFETAEGKWVYDFLPIPTDLCDLCETRVAAGKNPTCVHHCQSDIMRYGTIEELSVMAAEKPKMVLFTLS